MDSKRLHSKVETTQLWSIYKGKYQTYHTIRVEDHGILNMTDLSTRSYYTDSTKTNLGRRLLCGTRMLRKGNKILYGNDVWYRLNKDGLRFVREENKDYE